MTNRVIAVRRFVFSTYVFVAALAGCGAPTGTGPAANARGTDAANVARQAAEPRTGDPTAALPTPMNPTAGTTATLTPPAPSARASGDDEPRRMTPSAAKSDGDARDAPKRIGARHVLIQWMGSERAPSSVVRSREQALSVAQEVLRRARNKEDFARLAIEYSDEPGAGGRGGSLGRFGHGQMVPAFDAAAFKLEVGEISDIIETPFGYHIILRTE